MLARFEAVLVIAVLVAVLVMPGAASAASGHPAPDPSPQKAPASPAPTPDPAPQAAARVQPSHATPPPTTPRYTSTSIAPRLVRVTPPAHRSGVPVASSGGRPATRRPIRHAHPAAVNHPTSHHARPAPSPRVSLSFLAIDLARLTSGLRDGKLSHPSDGVLLLLTALAMATLAASSFALLRRLKRLGGPAR